MKVSIYIVDDEQMAINYFNYLLKASGVDCLFAGQATNVKKALEDIRRLKPDIVFTDISMPVMDGLELSRQILKFSSPKIFLLTAYRDFDFVKQGIQIGITDYILKNELTEDLLKDLLLHTIADITVERRKQHRILEYNVRNFLLSDSGNIEGHLYEDRPLQRYGLIIVQHPSKIYIKHHPEQDLFRVDCYELQNLTYPEGLTCSAFGEMSPQELCGIFFIGAQVSDGQFVLKKAAEIILATCKEAGEECICLISDTLYQFLELPGCHRELVALVDYTYAFPFQNIFQAALLRKRNINTPPNDWKSTFDAFLEELDTQFLKISREELLHPLKEMLLRGRMELDLWEYTESLRNLFRVLKTHVQKNQLNPALLDFPSQIQNAEEADSIILSIVNGIYDQQEAYREYSSYVHQAISFIQNNYREDISVPDIAEAVKVSEGHLRRCFKQELDMKIVDYLTEYRLECAKQLMKQGDESIGEVWRKTGFTSAQYFSYVFKKKEGMLPRDYMKQIKDTKS